MKLTLTTNDLLAVGGAALALGGLAAFHWALAVFAAGAVAAGVGVWRNRHEPPDGGPRPA